MPLDKDRIQAILFDVDGTLRDTDDQYVGRVALILRPLRWLLPNRDATRLARWFVMRFEGPVNRLIGLADRLGLDAPLHRFFDWANPWKGTQREQKYVLIPGASEAVARLATRYPLAVVTTRGASSTASFLEATDLLKHFLAVADGLTTRRGKPAPDPLIWAADQLGIPIENCLMVGDTVVDIQAARAGGAQSVALLSGFGEEDELVASGADLLLSSAAELPGALLDD